MQKLLSIMLSHLSIFVFDAFTLGVIFNDLSPRPMSRTYVFFFSSFTVSAFMFVFNLVCVGFYIWYDIRVRFYSSARGTIFITSVEHRKIPKKDRLCKAPFRLHRMILKAEFNHKDMKDLEHGVLSHNSRC